MEPISVLVAVALLIGAGYSIYTGKKSVLLGLGVLGLLIGLFVVSFRHAPDAGSYAIAGAILGGLSLIALAILARNGQGS